ncbi:MAG TPA: aryl-sulfate sulfotransferase [Ignavibacteria bacterium]|nr:aryl-sulfate sulfotransferase [Ignavibacteria bacterium]
MKIKLFILNVILFALLSSAYTQTVCYVSPVPNSGLNNEKTNIIIGYTSSVNPQNVSFSVTGSHSGFHTGIMKSVENNTKVLFIPDSPFTLGDSVSVTISGYPLSFYFLVRNSSAGLDKIKVSDFPSNFESNSTPLNDTLPPLVITDNGNTSPGEIFISNFNNSSTTPSFLMILGNSGNAVFSRELPYRGYDFKKQDRVNLLSYYEESLHGYLCLDSNYNITDTFFCGNGYSTDLHEFRLMEDGSAWLLCYDNEYVDMSKIVPGGYTNAVVTGLVVQHVDKNKNVVFQWRSWDHFQITDATHENLALISIDYVHGNAIEIDNDNNIMISSRHLDEITKINTQTGNIIWRLGGKNNQFIFTNDTLQFSHQHAIRRLANGHIIMFDNGNYHTPPFSRAVEYNLDELNKTCTKTWEYRHNPSISAFAMGNAQRLPNGNTMIGWGSASTTLTEVDSTGQILYELDLPAGQMSYRAYRYSWNDIMTPVINPTEIAKSYALYQNYPNPFNPVTTIKFQIPDNGNVSLRIFDITGRMVDEIASGFYPKGIYEVNWNAEKFSSGIYFYMLRAGNVMLTQKMILLK